MTEAWQLLLIEPLHGLSFAFPMAAMCAKTSVLAPEGMTATLMGLTQGVYWGLGIRLCNAEAFSPVMLKLCQNSDCNVSDLWFVFFV